MRLGAYQRDIARRALQSALAGTLAFVATQVSGTGEAFLAIISAVYVLETNRGQTLRTALSRITGALIGTLIGGVALAVTSAGAGVWPLALGLFVMGGIAAWKPGWTYGLVAATGLAIGTDLPFWEAAGQRIAAVAIGVGSGILVGFVAWPESTRKRARRQIGEALALCRDLLDETMSSALSRESEDVHDLHTAFNTSIMAAGDTARAIRPSRGGQHYRDLVHGIERLWHALIILDRVTETQRGDLPLEEDTLERVKSIQSATCEALKCVARFERVPPEDLEALRTACSDIWNAERIDPDREDELQSIALVFGLGEVSRNMGEIDQTICAITKSG